MIMEFLALALSTVCAIGTYEQEPKSPSLTVLSKDSDALPKAFNRDSDKTRLLLLVSPT